MKSVSLLVAAGAALVAPAAAVWTIPNCKNDTLSKNGVCNQALSPHARAMALVNAMNITEKLLNLVDRAPGSARLGLPAYDWWSEALHGVAGSPAVQFAGPGQPFSYATSFPMPIVLSAAFDDNLVYEVADTISTEFRAYSNAGRDSFDAYTPNLNPYKDPRWGRGSETPGEDPTRIRGYTKALLHGLEHYGEQPVRKMIATCKHYAGYDMEIWYQYVRYGFNAIIGLQDLSEYYLPMFQQCARDSNVGAIMCSYNAINGTPSCANSYIMQDILREHWNWTRDNNYVSTDCNAVLDIAVNHNYTNGDLALAAADAYNAGTDVVCEVPPPTPSSWPLTNQTGAYENGELTEATIDRALGRLYEGLVHAGYFDGPNAPYRDITWSSVNTQAAQDLAVKVAESGFVLKKNNGLLPYNFAGKSVALIGMWANATYSMLGGYSGQAPYYHNPVYAAQQLGLTVHYATGPTGQNLTVTDTWTINALAAANAADVIIYAGGIDGSIEAEALDRYNITWPAAQLALLEKLATLGKPLIVAQMGDQVDDTPILRNGNVGAIVWCGFPGQSGGTALFNILTGKTAPAGRLPVTQYPGDYVNQVTLVDMYLRPAADNPGRTYRWYNQSVLPFGHGMHYTSFKPQIRKDCVPKSFAISDLMAGCKEAHPDLCAFPKVGITVTNTGNVTSDFVALAFLSGQYGPAPYPIKTLANYVRLSSIAPHATAKATLQMTLGNVARTDVQGNLVLYPGKYTLLLDVPTSDEVSFELTGNAVTLDQFPQPPADAGAAVPT